MNRLHDYYLQKLMTLQAPDGMFATTQSVVSFTDEYHRTVAALGNGDYDHGNRELDRLIERFGVLIDIGSQEFSCALAGSGTANSTTITMERNSVIARIVFNATDLELITFVPKVGSVPLTPYGMTSSAGGSDAMLVTEWDAAMQDLDLVLGIKHDKKLELTFNKASAGADTVTGTVTTYIPGFRIVS